MPPVDVTGDEIQAISDWMSDAGIDQTISAGYVESARVYADVQVKASVNDYSWNELSRISRKISESGSETAALQIAQKYHLVGSDGTLDGTQEKAGQTRRTSSISCSRTPA